VVFSEHRLQSRPAFAVRRPQQLMTVDLEGIEHNEVGRHLLSKPGGGPPL
jgi:hypothetical protein